MPTIHLGINACFAVKRWPEPEQWIKIVKHDLGLDCCQFSLDQIDPLFDEQAVREYAGRVREIAAENKLVIHSVFTGLAAYSWSQLLHPDAVLREAAMRWYERAFDLTSQLGARGMGGHLGAFSVRDAADAERKAYVLADMVERLKVLAQSARQRGLEFLLVENMAVEREYGHTIEEAQALLKSMEGASVPLLLCLDVGHPCALRTGTSSDDYRTWLGQSWPQTPVLHLQQTDRSGDHHWPFTAAYNQQGIVRTEPIIQAAHHWSTGNDIYLFLEPIHPFEAADALVLDELRESVAYWRDALQSWHE